MTSYVPSVFRTAVALLCLAAIGAQLGLQRHLGLSLLDFFSYFTILANLFASVVLLASAAGRRPAGVTAESVRGAAVAMMAIVGLVFAILLRDADLGPLLPWVNTVTHQIMPVAVVMDWLLWPPRHAIMPRRVAPWTLFPLLYLAYVLVRGAMVGWYPYPFLDPDKVGGYGGVALYAVGILVAFLVVSALLAVGARRGRRIEG